MPDCTSRARAHPTYTDQMFLRQNFFCQPDVCVCACACVCTSESNLIYSCYNAAPDGALQGALSATYGSKQAATMATAFVRHQNSLELWTPGSAAELVVVVLFLDGSQFVSVNLFKEACMTVRFVFKAPSGGFS